MIVLAARCRDSKVHAIAHHDDSVESQPRLGAVPGDELVDGVLVDSARSRRAEAAENSRFYNDPDPAVAALGDGNSA